MREVWNDEQFVDEIIATLEKELPPIFARGQLPYLLGGALTIGSVANMQKNGPPYVINSRKAIYSRPSFLAWYRQYLLSTSIRHKV